MKALTKERKRRGFSFTKTAKVTGLSEQQLRNLERDGHTRETDPSSIQVRTMVKLLEVFERLELSDFYHTHLKIRRRK